jgi:lipoprotein-anchoring transpeptidase ErfK/SrfK
LIRRQVLLAIVGASLAACSPSRPKLPVAVHDQEPFPVPPINRSRFAERFWPSAVDSPFAEPVGTLVVDTKAHQLYLIEAGGKARRYGVAVGESGKAWSGKAVVGRKAKWPSWHPTDDMRAITSGLPRTIAPGPENPLGARALYLYRHGKDTLYRIHGTSEPWTIGTDASSGCIRMINEDVIELYERVAMGASVIVR